LEDLLRALNPSLTIPVRYCLTIILNSAIG
jgi:hypothetical protein